MVRTLALPLVASAALLATVSARADQKAVLRLDDPGSSRLALLEAFHNAEIEAPGPVRLYIDGRWGRWEREPWMSLAWSPGAASAASRFGFGGDTEHRGPLVEARSALWSPSGESWQFANSDAPAIVSLDALAALAASRPAIGLDASWSLPSAAKTAPAPVPWQQRCWRRPVTFVRYGGETDTFALVGCDGSVATEALDRLTLMARPPEVPRPGELLPDEPDDAAWARGEWIDNVRPVNARLVWLLQRIADGFPRRVIYVYSGYRPKNSGPDPEARARSMHSMHGEARAMDISVYGIRNEDLFRYCRTLDDVGCGYYPNSKFVHVDVRRPRTGHAFWVDASGPGERSRYVDAWPGVVESGAMVWNRKAAAAQSAAASPSSAPSTPAEVPAAADSSDAGL